jgi:hypothetical protein
MGREYESTRRRSPLRLSPLAISMIIILLLSNVLVYNTPLNISGNSLADSLDDDKETEKDSNGQERNSTNSSRSRRDRTDSDNDGLDDNEEIERGTDPESWDSDGDGKADSQDYYPLNPSLWRSPVQIFLQVILEVCVFFTIIFSFLIFRRLRKKNTD